MKYCAIAIALLVVHATSTIDAHSPIVPICFEQNAVLLPMPDSCSGFFICVNGNAITASCGNYYHFNAEKSFCDVPEHAGCQTYEAQLQQLHFESSIGSEKQPDDIVYWPVMPMLPEVPPILPPPQTIPAATAALPKPQHPDEVVANLTAGTICEGRDTGKLLPKPDSCRHYYVCIIQRPYRRTCPPHMHFNPRLQICQKPHLAQCIPMRPHHTLPLAPAPVRPAYPIAAAPLTPPASPAASIQATTTDQRNPLDTLDKPQITEILHQLQRPMRQNICANSLGQQQLMPHPADCGQFIICNHGRAKEMQCPANLHFNAKQQRCDWPGIAKCNL